MSSRWSALAILALAALVGCGKDKAVGPKPAEIYGTWTATSVEYVSRSAPPARMDLCDSAGCGATFMIGSDHAAVLIIHAPGAPQDTTTGTWQLDEDEFKMYPSGTDWQWVWKVSLSASTLRLTGAVLWWDFQDGNGGRDSNQNMTLVR
jgi:hypothetical protein